MTAPAVRAHVYFSSRLVLVNISERNRHAVGVQPRATLSHYRALLLLWTRLPPRHALSYKAASPRKLEAPRRCEVVPVAAPPACESHVLLRSATTRNAQCGSAVTALSAIVLEWRADGGRGRGSGKVSGGEDTGSSGIGGGGSGGLTCIVSLCDGCSCSSIDGTKRQFVGGRRDVTRLK